MNLAQPDPQAYAAFLFDMDGTLLTSIPAVERAWTAWAQRVGVPVDAVLAYLHGRRALDTVRHFAPAGAQIADEVAWIDDREVADIQGVAAIPGAVALLQSLPADRWAVVTSASARLARRRIEAAGLPQPRVLVTADDVGKGKPDPEGYRRAAERLGVDPARCLVFEDAEAGLQAGRAAGAAVIRIAGPHGTAQASDAPMLRDYRDVRALAGPAGLALHGLRDAARP